MNRGGTVENIYMTQVTADHVRHVLAADLNWNPSYSYSTYRLNMKVRKFWNIGKLC